MITEATGALCTLVKDDFGLDFLFCFLLFFFLFCFDLDDIMANASGEQIDYLIPTYGSDLQDNGSIWFTYWGLGFSLQFSNSRELSTALHSRPRLRGVSVHQVMATC